MVAGAKMAVAKAAGLAPVMVSLSRSRFLVSCSVPASVVVSVLYLLICCYLYMTADTSETENAGDGKGMAWQGFCVYGAVTAYATIAIHLDHGAGDTPLVLCLCGQSPY